MKSLADIAGLNKAPTQRIGYNYTFDLNPDALSMMGDMLSGKEPTGLMKPEPYIIPDPKKPAQLTGKEALEAFDYMNAFPQETGKLAVAGSDRTYPSGSTNKLENLVIKPDEVVPKPTKGKETPPADKGFDYDELHRRFEAMIAVSSELGSGNYENDPKKQSELAKQLDKLEAEYRQMADSSPIPKPTTTKFLPPEIKPDEEVTKPEPPAEKVDSNTASKIIDPDRLAASTYEPPVDPGPYIAEPEQTVPVRTGKDSGADKTRRGPTKEELRAKLAEDLLDSVFGGPMKPVITPIEFEKETTTSEKETTTSPSLSEKLLELKKAAILEKSSEEMKRNGVDPSKPIDYDKVLAGYKPTWFQDNTVEKTFGKRSDTDTEEAKEARGAALRILKAADVSADRLKDWFSVGKGYDMLSKSVAEDLAWEEGIDVKDVPKQKIYDATFQLIANRTSQFQNARLGFEEMDMSGFPKEYEAAESAGFVTPPWSPPDIDDMRTESQFMRPMTQDRLYRRPSKFQYKNEKGETVERIPTINFPESFLRKYFAGEPKSKFNKELEKEYESGKISKKEYLRRFVEEGMHEPVEKVVSHEVSHLADILMPTSDLQFIKDIVNKRNAGKERDEYLSDPREIMARIRNMRDWWASQQQKSGDKSDFTREQLSKTALAEEVDELIEGAKLTWEDIVKIANKVSVNEPKKKGKSLLDVASNNNKA
jgi:hypothetical protein